MFNILFIAIFIAIVLIVISMVIMDKLRIFHNIKLLIVSSVVAIVISVYLSIKLFTNIIWYHYSETTGIAERGIIFKDKILLSEHRLIGSSDYGIFEMDKYSRSDRQLEVINVIVNKNKYSEK